MPCLEELRLKTGQLVTEDWYTTLCDFLCELGYGGVISAYGYVSGDLIPISDLLFNLGIPLKRFKELHAGWGFFDYYVYINNKLVLKDGDCITIGGLENQAKTDFASAIDQSSLLQDEYAVKVAIGADHSTKLGAIADSVAILQDEYDVKVSIGAYQSPRLELIANAFVPVRIGKLWEQNVNAFTDFFTPDLVALYDGRLRVKLTVEYDCYAYLKHKLNGEASFVNALLNAGITVPENCWHEWDFTIEKDDEANLSVSTNTKVTVIVYNIPSA